MAHHGFDPFDDNEKAVEKFKKLRNLTAIITRVQELEAALDAKAFRGATGEFPEGKLTPSDEGAIQFAVHTKDGKVVLDFGTPVTWLAATPEQAMALAQLLIKEARRANYGGAVPLKIEI